MRTCIVLALALGACTSSPSQPPRAMPADFGVDDWGASEPSMESPSGMPAPDGTDVAAAEMGLTPPTAEHTMLQQGVGTWEGTVTMFAPGMPPEPMPAKETVWALGQYWTQSRFACDMGGMKLNGSGTLGYDPVKAIFVGTWIDNFNPELAIMEGKAGADGKSISMTFTARNPATGEPTKQRIETVFSEGSYVSTFFIGEGEGTKSMMIEMKRAGGAP